MAALMEVPNILVYTHDSIGLGEDGPTHQPIEHTASLRLIPNLRVWRPCDTVETAVAWRAALERRDGPTALIFSRQTLPHQERDAAALRDIQRGGYILADCDGTPEAVLIATGSEVALAREAARRLAGEGRRIRVVSMPCPEVFEAQDSAYRESVLPASVRARVAVEALHADYWHKYVGLDGRILGMRGFGESAPGGELMRHFGFTAENLLALVAQVVP